jgi:GxxExxY protein
MALVHEELTEQIIGAAIDVHRHLGPGLLESAYRVCLIYELKQRGLAVRGEVPMPLVYKEVRLDVGYRLDLLVEDAVVVEVKAVKALLPVHEAQLLSYLKLSGARVGFLMNFHVRQLRTGLKRMVL